MVKWRTTKEYRLWRIAVIRRDGRCIICGSLKRREAHHIKNGQHHPRDRFDIENGVTLCRSCHVQLHTNFKNSFREKCTEKDWINFLALSIYFIKLGKLQSIKSIEKGIIWH